MINKYNTAYLSLGSNLGNKRVYIKKALKMINTLPKTRLIKASKLYVTKPVRGPKGQQDFINAACIVHTKLTPSILLQYIQQIELDLKRVRKIKWGPRTIDIDIIFFNNYVIDKPNLVVPHPLAHKRAFVMNPLNELNPSYVHPLLRKSIKQINDGLSKKEGNNMKVIKSIKIMQKYSQKTKLQNMKIGFVPTMGALHQGHFSLIKKAVKENDITVVSIYVNPTQFGPGEDLSKYPKTLKKDKKALIELGCDVLFLPDNKSMYPEEFETFINQNNLPHHLCGKTRRGHFSGVMTVCTKLFNIVLPDIAYFGMKDYQQSVIIKRLLKDLNYPMQIKVLPIVREKDMLAMSSRNKYLTHKERELAPNIYKGLVEMKNAFKEGITNSKKLQTKFKTFILQFNKFKVEYVNIIHPDTLEDVKIAKKGDVIAVAVKLGKARLIDNIIL